MKLLDAAFLHAETAATPMHVGALFILDMPDARSRSSFFQRLRDTVAARLGASEVFTRRLATLPLDAANPMWATTTDIDLDHHLRRTVLPRPGTRRQLENRVAHLHEPLLDRGRPLWELHVIEGLEGGGTALYVKVHHAGLDGQSAQVFLRAFMDPAPETPAAALRAPLPEADVTSTTRLLAAGIRHQVGEIRRLPRRLTRVASAALKLAREHEVANPEVPRTVLNEVVSGHRRFAAAEIPLEEAHRVAGLAGATVNDVVLSATAGALRRWLLQQGLLPRQPLFAGVPVSVRPPGDTEYAIQVTFISVNLHTGLAEPLARLDAIRRSAADAKLSAEAHKSLVPEDVPSIGLPWLLGGVAWAVGHRNIAGRVPLPFNVVVSNVPGPPEPIYVAGARASTFLPISIVYHGVGLNLTVYSYDGRLFAGIVTCADLVPDPERLARWLSTEFGALRDALSGKPVHQRRRVRPGAPSGKRRAAARRG